MSQGKISRHGVEQAALMLDLSTTKKLFPVIDKFDKEFIWLVWSAERRVQPGGKLQVKLNFGTIRWWIHIIGKPKYC